MTKFVLLGLGVGSLYSLAALGVVAIHRGSQVLNLAHGAIALWGAYVFIELRDTHGLPAGAAAVATLAGAAVLGVVLYALVIRPLRARTPLTKMVATLGILVILDALAADVFGVQSRTAPSWLPNDPVDVLGARIGVDRIILLGIAVGATVVLALWSARARLPLATRAMSEHEEAATSLGFSPHVLGAANWALGCALAALAGLLIAPVTGLPSGVALIVVPAIAAALVGRFNSYWWALAGGLLIGVSESLVTKYVTEPGWTAAVPFLVVIAVLLVRREQASNRVAAQDAILVGVLRPWLALVILAGGLAFVSFASIEYVDASIISIALALLALSLVVLIGFANQISLAQMAIAGIGAFAAGRLSAAGALPFEIAPLVGAAAGAAIGVLIGLPALRVRGVNLAVVTLGLSLAVERVVFQNASYTGGIDGIRPETPTVFGLSVDAIEYPRRYAYVCLFWLAVALAVVMILRRSARGRRLLAMRTNERAAAAQGVSVPGSKLTAFAIASALAGAAGVLLGFRQPIMTFEPFNFFESMNLVTQSVVGGIAVATGALVAGVLAAGGVVFRFVEGRDVALISDNYALLFGIGLIAVLRFHPAGLAQLRAPKPDRTTIAPGEAAGRPAATLRATDVSVRFGAVHAVDDVSLTVEPGRVVGLIGPNGAGKTTLLDALCGFVRPQRGHVVLGARTLTRARPNVRARAGLGRVFQELELFEDLTVAQNLLVAAGNAGRGRRLPPLALAFAARMGVVGDLDRRPGELSLSRRRIAGILRALAGNPSVLLLDEPGAGLSMTESRELADAIRSLAVVDGLGVLVVDHDMGLIMSACDEIVVLVEGREVARDVPAAIVGDETVRAAYLGETAVVVP